MEKFTDRPTERLTRLADAAVEAVKRHPEYQRDDGVMALVTATERIGSCFEGMGATEAVAMLLVRVAQVVAREAGIELSVHDVRSN